MSSLKALAADGRAQLATLAETLRRWPWMATARTLRQRFREDRLGQSAGSLTFTTLIALVPLVTVMLAVFTAFPMFGSFQGALEKYFLQSLVPDSIARPVLRALTQFAAKARGVGSAGLLLLVATALSMMLTIDRTLNGIWRVRRPRPIAQRILVYWAALTLGPLAVGVSLSVTSYLLSASKGLVGALPGGVNLVFDLLQFGLLAAAMAGLFHYVPNTFVRWSHAWAGAVFVALGFEVAKSALAWYVERMATFSAVYGAFATLPILLLWIYLGWVIVLLGAVIAAYAPSLEMRVAVRRDLPGARFVLALELLAALLRVRGTSGGALALQPLAVALRTDPLQVESVVDRLVQIGWVGRLDEAGAQRLVLLGEPAALPLAPLVDALLMAPGGAGDAVVQRSGLRALTLADALRDAGLS
ncbi:MAG: YihY family inner membrane protein [Rubrivivax sp.]